MVTRISTSDFLPMRKLRIQFQLFGEDKKFSKSKNITIFDEDKIIDLDELHKKVFTTIKDYIETEANLIKSRKIEKKEFVDVIKISDDIEKKEQEAEK